MRDAQHTDVALRFRAIGRDGEGCTELAKLLAALPAWGWERTRVLSPGAAGFFLGREISRIKGIPHAVARSDGRRLTITELLTGEIKSGERVVLVNDVGSTGSSLEPLCALVERCGASVVGALLFTVREPKTMESYCNARRISCHHLTTNRWEVVAPGPSCAGCRDKRALIPIGHLS